MNRTALVFAFHEQRTLKSFSMCAEFSVIFKDFQHLAIIENLFTYLYFHEEINCMIFNEIKDS
ncbi:hypothetical protein BFW41_11805 [Aeromonas hydrophila]|nr:hypothetical protein BOQ57_10115 [Aeromonas hydrophila]QJT19979.1 hypothetical protein E5E96_17745 [Aeromonas sp. 1805]AXV34574.1 hypothetical protein BFW41_11805 [Aeromonas hydrophila]KHA58425.1 hypothetical protein NM74_01270 [Aeromonas hydrophila]MBC6487883.1 hypothetical protein [Aeromonas hydrophila]